jgi:hypothetical protein
MRCGPFGHRLHRTNRPSFYLSESATTDRDIISLDALRLLLQLALEAEHRVADTDNVT